MCGGGKFVIGGKWSVGWEGLWWHRRMISWIISVAHRCQFARMILIINKMEAALFEGMIMKLCVRGWVDLLLTDDDVSVLLRVTAGGHNVT